MRFIDADSLMEKFCMLFHDDPREADSWDDVVADFCKMLQDEPTMLEWVQSSDRLPTEQKSYLAILRNPDTDSESITDVYFAVGHGWLISKYEVIKWCDIDALREASDYEDFAEYMNQPVEDRR